MAQKSHKVPALVHPLLRDQRKFGRLPLIDFRDKNYLLRSIVRPTITRKFRYWFAPTVLDQGDTSQCVAYSSEAFLAAGPVTNLAWKTPAELYHECQLVDEWPGEDYDGTSVRAAFKVLTKQGYIKEYRWAVSAEEVMAHVLSIGPVVMGTDWYNSQFNPKKVNGRSVLKVDPNSGLAGGHAWLILGASRTLKQFQMQNSWGTGWGDGGRAWINFDDLDMLIKSDGEACTSTELKFVESKASNGLPVNEPVESLTAQEDDELYGLDRVG